MKRKKSEDMSFEGNPKRKEPKMPKEATVLPNQEKLKPTSISLPKRKIISKINYGDVTLREFDKIDCDGATIIEGIPKFVFFNIFFNIFFF